MKVGKCVWEGRGPAGGGKDRPEKMDAVAIWAKYREYLQASIIVIEPDWGDDSVSEHRHFRSTPEPMMEGKNSIGPNEPTYTIQTQNSDVITKHIIRIVDIG